METSQKLPMKKNIQNAQSSVRDRSLFSKLIILDLRVFVHGLLRIFSEMSLF
jgi:hypothetical protein